MQSVEGLWLSIDQRDTPAQIAVRLATITVVCATAGDEATSSSRLPSTLGMPSARDTTCSLQPFVRSFCLSAKPVGKKVDAP